MANPFSNYDRGCIQLIVQHRIVFGTWSVLNILAGGLAMLLSDGPTWYFGIMCLFWGTANLLVWILLYVHTRETRFVSQGTDGRRWVQRHLELMFLLNVGLDLLYLACGVYLCYTADMDGPELTRMYISFGYAVMLQGAFLGVQDTTFWALHRRNFRKRRELSAPAP